MVSLPARMVSTTWHGQAKKVLNGPFTHRLETASSAWCCISNSPTSAAAAGIAFAKQTATAFRNARIVQSQASELCSLLSFPATGLRSEVTGHRQRDSGCQDLREEVLREIV